MRIRIGLANPNGRMPAELERRELPVLVSANSLFDHQRKRFREIPINLNDLDVALDSAGFVALSRYGGFPWTVAQYVELAGLWPFSWWSQMDFCCEPQIAADRAEVRKRVRATGTLLFACLQQYECWMGQAPELRAMFSPPMPVLQGWTPDDYRFSIELADAVLDGAWPCIVGVGSVCRRSLSGDNGLWRILHTIDTHLPAGVSVHLFGVKGAAVRNLAAWPRVASVDSMAFEYRARMQCREDKRPKTIDARVEFLDAWIERQTPTVSPQQMFTFGT